MLVLCSTNSCSRQTMLSKQEFSTEWRRPTSLNHQLWPRRASQHHETILYTAIALIRSYLSIMFEETITETVKYCNLKHLAEYKHIASRKNVASDLPRYNESLSTTKLNEQSATCAGLNVALKESDKVYLVTLSSSIHMTCLVSENIEGSRAF